MLIKGLLGFIQRVLTMFQMVGGSETSCPTGASELEEFASDVPAAQGHVVLISEFLNSGGFCCTVPYLYTYT